MGINHFNIHSLSSSHTIQLLLSLFFEVTYRKKAIHSCMLPPLEMRVQTQIVFQLRIIVKRNRWFDLKRNTQKIFEGENWCHFSGASPSLYLHIEEANVKSKRVTSSYSYSLSTKLLLTFIYTSHFCVNFPIENDTTTQKYLFKDEFRTLNEKKGSKEWSV
jgi:hypothetical protein